MGTEGNIRLLKKLRPTALIGMPTFLYHFLRQALEERVRCEGLTRLILGGEKVPEGMRVRLRELAAALGSPDAAVLATYGFTEAKAAWAECPTADGSPSGYHLYSDLGIVEVVNPETGEQVPDETAGEIVYTSLDARGTAVIRYRTGDFIDGGITYAPCPHCGRDWPRLIGNISRKSNKVEMHLDKLKGTLVDFDALEHVLDDFRHIGTWQLELRKLHDDPLDVDELVLHAEKSNGETDVELREKINATFSAATELHLNRILFHDPAEMRRLQGVGTELKEKRIVDHRPK
jgi:phenylacetate-coenzyme A ligase PaaK-like adenylate-forming protein